MDTTNKIYPWLRFAYEHFISLYHANKFPKVTLLHGLHGIGKTELAMQIAKAINIDNYILLENDDLKIDGIREVIRSSLQTNLVSDKNLYILLNIECLTDSSANALLKILESETVKTYFILTATNYHNVKATILSRCYKYDLKITDRNIVNNWLSSNGVDSRYIDELLDLTNNLPLLALDYFNNDYITKVNELQDKLISLNKSNITTVAESVSKLFTYKDAINKNQFNFESFALLMSYIFTKKRLDNIVFANKFILHDYLLEQHKNYKIGIKPDSYSLVYNLLYRFAYNKV